MPRCGASAALPAGRTLIATGAHLLAPRDALAVAELASGEPLAAAAPHRLGDGDRAASNLMRW
jgi:hypothetical protein